MKNIRNILYLAALTIALVAFTDATARGQAPDTTAGRRVAAMDSAFARARQLVISGQAAAGRQIADSILAAAPEGSDAYGSALYGRAMLAPTAADAEHDYRRIIVEYPLSAHAGDALLQLAQLERARGDRSSAIDHLQRFLRENPQSAKRARTGLWLAQLLFEQSNDIQACGVLNQARAATAPSDVELQNQMNFYSSRCAAAAANAAADSTARADSIRADSTARAEAHADSIRKAAAAAHKHEAHARANKGEPSAEASGYSVQMAAFGTRAEADQFVARLRTRGVEGHVDGTQKPFRVRVGRYKTRAEAVKAAAQFKALGLDGFVTGADGR